MRKRKWRFASRAIGRVPKSTSTLRWSPRRADVVWLAKDVKSFDKFRDACKKSGETIQDGIKKAVTRSLE